jgi:hypothetical protein
MPVISNLRTFALSTPSTWNSLSNIATVNLTSSKSHSKSHLLRNLKKKSSVHSHSLLIFS